MSRAFFLSILLHALAVAFVFVIFRQSSTYPTQSIKKISLSTVVIKKPVAKEAKSLEPKAKSEKLKVQSSKFEVVKKERESKLKAQKIKKVTKIVKKPIVKKKIKKKFAKNIHKSLKHKAKKHLKKLKAKSKKQKVHKSTKNKLPIINNKSRITNYQSLIYQAINSAKVYPRLAKRMGQQGRVYTCFTLHTNGSVSSVTTSGGSAILQKGARQTINRAKQNFPSLPKSMHLCVTISYVLE